MDSDTSKEYILRLLELQEQTFWNAIKYRYDPVVGKIYADYLEIVNALVEAI